jgi:hypothetical protein
LSARGKWGASLPWAALDYFESPRHEKCGWLSAFLVNSGLAIIFNRIFEAHFSRQKRAKSRFLSGKRATAVSIYYVAINQGAAARRSASSLPCFYFSP